MPNHSHRVRMSSKRVKIRPRPPSSPFSSPSSSSSDYSPSISAIVFVLTPNTPPATSTAALTTSVHGEADFPVFANSSVKESKIGSDHLECAIFLNELEDRETVRLLPICNHLFHIDCIDAWLYSHATCPVCRSNLTAKIDETGDPPSAENAAMRDHVTIDTETVEAANSQHLRPSSEIAGKFPRSNSTGHSIGRFSDGTERYTLRLPDDVKRRIMAAKGRRLKRTRRFDTDLTAECRGEFCQSGCHDEVGSGVKLDWVNWADRWGLFVTKSNSGSVRSQKTNGEPLK